MPFGGYGRINPSTELPAPSEVTTGQGFQLVAAWPFCRASKSSRTHWFASSLVGAGLPPCQYGTGALVVNLVSVTSRSSAACVCGSGSGVQFVTVPGTGLVRTNCPLTAVPRYGLTRRIVSLSQRGKAFSTKLCRNTPGFTNDPCRRSMLTQPVFARSENINSQIGR